MSLFDLKWSKNQVTGQKQKEQTKYMSLTNKQVPNVLLIYRDMKPFTLFFKMIIELIVVNLLKSRFYFLIHFPYRSWLLFLFSMKSNRRHAQSCTLGCIIQQGKKEIRPPCLSAGTQGSHMNSVNPLHGIL